MFTHARVLNLDFWGSDHSCGYQTHLGLQRLGQPWRPPDQTPLLFRALLDSGRKNASKSYKEFGPLHQALLQHCVSWKNWTSVPHLWSKSKFGNTPQRFRKMNKRLEAAYVGPRDATSLTRIRELEKERDRRLWLEQEY
ncbi:hypothetical protein PanWU01x14_096760 [Parasponia andersonii]|uniref:Uncharacterized protein n=1 Tax=Parasponia andersonii TaxID=3476 RepID=A0A2P5D515_PARAD|nr:hypothetical protein PanWU01x14_096760 [Parasponia andersonii]